MSSLIVREQQNERIQRDVKAAINSWIDAARPDISTADLATLYATSVASYRAANMRARVMSRVTFKAKENGVELPPKHPLMMLLREGQRERLQRSEWTHYFWGRNLILKKRSIVNPEAVVSLTWINPYLWAVDSDPWNGMVGFNIYRSGSQFNNQEQIGDIPLENGIYSHYMDFREDFDGVSPAQVGFMYAGTDSATGELAVSYMRNMAIPAGAIMPETGEEDIQKEDAERVADFVRRFAQGIRNFGRVLVTPRRWKWVQFQLDLDKLALKDMSEGAARKVYEAAEVPYEVVNPSASTYAQAYVTYKSWFDLWVKPTAEWYAEIYQQQLATEYGRIELEPDYSKLDFLKEDPETKSRYVNLQVSSTVRDLYSAQEELGIKPDPALKGLYMVGGTPVPVEALRTYYQEKGAQQGPMLGTFGLTGLGQGNQQPAQENPMLPPQPAQLSLRNVKASDGTPGGTVIIDLLGSVQIKAAWDYLRATMDTSDHPIRWSTPDMFHITVCHARLIDEPQFGNIFDSLNGLTSFMVTAGPVDIFEQDDQNVLILRVDLTDELRAVQTRVYEAFAAEGVEVGEYSQPDNWQPHITLAYMSKEIEVPTFDQKITVPVNNLTFSREDYRLNYVVSFASEPVRRAWIPDAVMDDFTNWRKVASRAGWDAQFTAKSMPADTAAYVRILLDSADTEDALNDIFITARRHYIANHAGTLKAYGQTEVNYRTALYGLVTGALEGRIDRKGFGDLGRAEITVGFNNASRDGLKDGGVNTDVLDEDEARDLQLQIKAERGYWTALANEIYRQVLPLRTQAQEVNKQARQTTDPAERERLQNESLEIYKQFLNKRKELIGRIDTWVNKGLKRIYDLGKLWAKSNQMQIWVYGDTIDHCKTCSKAQGQIHRAKDWLRKGIVPRGDGLECGGFKCDCRFEDTTEKARGRLDRIPLFGTEKHVHEDEPVETWDDESEVIETPELESEHV
jgi:2'-5' RNA ligase